MVTISLKRGTPDGDPAKSVPGRLENQGVKKSRKQDMEEA
jgi:hypothetical protein